MRDRIISRRTMLRGMGGAAVALPLLAATQRSSFAQDAQLPRRLITFFSPNGMHGWPEGEDLSGSMLEPLASHWDDLIVTRGLDMVSAYADPSPNDGSHYNGWAHCLVADDCYPDGDSAGRTGGGISFDMLAAERICRDTRFASSLQGISSVAINEGLASLSWQDANVAAPPDPDVRRVFDRLFSDFEVAPDELAQVRARRSSILDYVRASSARLSCRLGTADRARLDQHLTAIRDLESRLSAPGVGGGMCAVPDAPGADLDYPATGRAQMDLLAMALACDLTRVGSIQYTQAVGGGTPSWLGMSSTHHDISHLGTQEGLDDLLRINQWYAGEFAYLLDALRAIPEGDGTLLDNTAVVWVSEVGCAATAHDRHDLGILLAGKAGGALSTGRFLQFDGTPHNNLWVELINAVLPDGEEPITTFGNADVCTGGLPELRG